MSWAWLDAVNLNSVAGYQTFLKLYANNDDLNASARRLSGRVSSASGNEVPDALGLAPPRGRTVVREASAADCGGGGAGPHVRPVPISAPHVLIQIRQFRPTVLAPHISVGRVRQIFLLS